MRSRGNPKNCRCLNDEGPIHASIAVVLETFYDAQQMAIGYWRCMCMYIHVPLTCV
jgi:hypothetical protein